MSINGRILLYGFGVLFISLARFKEEIAKSNIDINVLGVGLALIAIALVLTTRDKEQKSNNNNLAKNASNEVLDEKEEMATDQELPSIDIMLDEVRRTLDFQFEQLDGLAAKSGIALGIAGVILTLLVSSLIGHPSAITNSILVKIALAPIILSLILSFTLIFVRKWPKPPQLERLRTHYINEAANDTKLNIIDISMKAITNNEKRIKRRVILFNTSYSILAIGFVLLAFWIGTVVWQ